MHNTITSEKTPVRTRLIVRKGAKNMPLRLEDIALFYTESKVIFAIDRDNNKYLCDKNLSELECLLDARVFFRANRQTIVNINFIKTFQTYQRVKIQVEMAIAGCHYPLLISQVTVTDFKKWLSES